MHLNLCQLIAYSEAKDAVLSKAFEKLIIWGLSPNNNLDKKCRLPLFEAYLTHFTRLDLDLLASCLVCDTSCSNNRSTTTALQKVERRIVDICHKMLNGDRNDKKILYDTLDEFKLFLEKGDHYRKTKDVIGRSIFQQISSRLALLRPSSANTERLFSGLKHIQTDRKAKMLLETLEDLMRIKVEETSNQQKVKKDKNTEQTTDEDDHFEEETDETEDVAELIDIAGSDNYNTFFNYIQMVSDNSSSSSSSQSQSAAMDTYTAEELHEMYLRERERPEDR